MTSSGFCGNACTQSLGSRRIKAEPSWQCALLCRQDTLGKSPISHEYIFLVHIIFVLRQWRVRSLGTAWQKDCFKTKNKLDKTNPTLPHPPRPGKGQVSKQHNLSKTPGPSGQPGLICYRNPEFICTQDTNVYIQGNSQLWQLILVGNLTKLVTSRR